MKPTIRPIIYKGFYINFTDNSEDLKALKGKNMKDFWCVYFNDKKSGNDIGVRLPIQENNEPKDTIRIVFEGVQACMYKIDMDILKVHDKTTKEK